MPVFLSSHPAKKSDGKLIIGTWEAKTSISKFYEDGIYQYENATTFGANELTFEFKKDNTYTTYGGRSFS